MADRLFEEPRLARLYDAFCRGRPDFEFYLPLVMDAHAVLDVGCGTGELLRLAREAGHRGRLCGLDPADAMLEEARVCSDVEWHLGDVARSEWTAEFDQIVMTGHAFQVLVEDEQIRRSLRAVRQALRADGRFVFETRNPAVRGWEDWVPDNAVEITTSDGERIRMAHQVQAVAGDLVTFTVAYSCPGWERDEVSWSTLRFLDATALPRFLNEAGLVVESQLGSWSGNPLTPTSEEIITIARPG
ncbi:MAG: class I SAM-dependent methyltransferase [Actinobacteria bacterium]|nr:class I SAM-dependent methyltransferase [Actinomycetota bacterium]